jgi:hypothetical protein
MGYVKIQADNALKAGNYKDAYTKCVMTLLARSTLSASCRYSDCLDILPRGHKESLALYTNRSLAYAKVSVSLSHFMLST